MLFDLLVLFYVQAQQCLIQLQLLRLTFALVYSELFSQCFILLRDLFMPWHSPFVAGENVMVAHRPWCAIRQSSVSVYLFVSCPVYLFRNACLGIYIVRNMKMIYIYICSTWVLGIRNILMLDNDVKCNCRVLLLSSPFPCSSFPYSSPLSDKLSHLGKFFSFQVFLLF